MPRIRVSIAISALRDLDEVLAYYLEQGVPQTGERLVGEVIVQIESLADHPDRGRMVPEFSMAALRELIHPPFRIVYRREPEKVRVVRIWRSEHLLKLP
jgi:plasmid stabilization system protein ParE